MTRRSRLFGASILCGLILPGCQCAEEPRLTDAGQVDAFFLRRDTGPAMPDAGRDAMLDAPAIDGGGADAPMPDAPRADVGPVDVGPPGRDTGVRCSAAPRCVSTWRGRWTRFSDQLPE